MPNVVKDPVKCYRDGSVVPGSHSLNVSTSHCQQFVGNYLVNTRYANASIFKRCTTGQEVGRGFIAIGSIHDYAKELADSMLDHGFLSEHQANFTGTTSSVECTVDVGPSVGFRTVTYQAPKRIVSDNGA